MLTACRNSLRGLVYRVGALRCGSVGVRPRHRRANGCAIHAQYQGEITLRRARGLSEFRGGLEIPNVGGPRGRRICARICPAPPDDAKLTPDLAERWAGDRGGGEGDAAAVRDGLRLMRSDWLAGTLPQHVRLAIETAVHEELRVALGTSWSSNWHTACWPVDLSQGEDGRCEIYP